MIGPHPLIQALCFGIVLLYVTLRLRDPFPLRFLKHFFLLVAVSWISEDIAISIYDFYGYKDGWWPMVHHVPLLVILIWPVVIHSLMDLIDHLAPKLSPLHFALIASFLVLTDAALIEPISVNLGFWAWAREGVFGVPLMGILGWGIMTFAFLYTWRRFQNTVLTLLLAPLLTHLGIVIAWWAFFRTQSAPFEESSALILALVLSLTATFLALKAKPLDKPQFMMRRLPGALFFFTLLFVFLSANTSLVLYTFVFALPWLSLLGKWAIHRKKKPVLTRA